MNMLMRWGFVIIPPASLFALPAPLRAQQDQAVSSAVCMARPGDSADSAVFVIVVPARAQSAMADRGYTPHPCSGDPEAFVNYRSKVCHLANDAPAVVQGQFVQQYNVSPRELCDMANALTGPS
jgi:hypothetical protein